MAGTEYVGATVKPRDHIPEFCLSTQSGNHTITHFHSTDKSIRNPALSLLNFNMSKITRKHTAYWQINTSRLFSHTRLIQVPGCTVTRSADQQIPCCPGQSSPAILLSPNRFDSQKPVLEAKDLVVTLKKQTISYLCVSARIRVIDPFNQNTTWHWTMQTLRIVLRLNVPSRPSQSFTLRKTVTLSGTETSVRRALISNNCHLCQTENSGQGRKNALQGGRERERGGGWGGGGVRKKFPLQSLLYKSLTTKQPNKKKT